MLNLKKTAVAVLALSSSAVFAGGMGPVCSAVPVTMPCPSEAWVVGGKALYLNTNTGGQDSTGVRTASSSGGSLSTNSSANYGWGFNVFGAMKYGTGRDIVLGWNHINNSFSKTFAPQSITGNQAFLIGSQVVRSNYISAVSVTSGGAVNAPKWDAVNMEFGQRVDFSDVTFMRPFFGWQWARLGASNIISLAGNQTHVTEGTAGASTPYAFSQSSNPDFNGFGPRVGLDGVYKLFAGLDIYAKGGFGLLAGYNKSSSTYTDSATLTSVTSSTNTVTTPMLFDGKLGADYTYETQGFGSLTLDVDWAWYGYVGPFTRSSSPLSSGTPTNFTLQGLEFGLTWAGDSV